MEKLKEYKYVILIIILILGFIFYWFEYRPIQIKKDCYKKSQESMFVYYDDCLKEKGLE